MPFIRLTQKLQKEAGLKSANLAVGEKRCAPFEEWYAHVFLLDRKKQIIFMEPQTLFSFCVENVGRKDIREQLPELFEKGLGKALFVEGVSAQIMSKVMDVCRGEIIFTKTESRKAIGAMNEFVKHQKYAFWDQSRPIYIQDRCNRYMPSRGFPDGSKDYKFPIEVFAQIVKEQFDLDFTPHKEDFYEKIHSEDPFDL
ncbi:DUF6933 domain-containing protein [Candidatus Omnitrophota bacterium]